MCENTCSRVLEQVYFVCGKTAAAVFLDCRGLFVCCKSRPPLRLSRECGGLPNGRIPKSGSRCLKAAGFREQTGFFCLDRPVPPSKA